MQQTISEQIQKEIASGFPGWKAVAVIGGGMDTVVYRIHKDGEKDQALKVISSAQARQDIEDAEKEGVSFVNEYKKGMCLNWEREVSIIRAVNACPYVVHTHECKAAADAFGVPQFMIRMELLKTLKDVIPTMTVKDAVQMGIDICRAIDFYNKSEIIHCDIKPENIYRDEDGRFKLGDFCSAVYTSETNRPPRCTDLYAAPEIKNGKGFGKSIDLYALGLVLFGLLNGQYPPFIEERSPDSFPSEEQIRQSIETRAYSAGDIGQACQATSELNELLNYACSYNPNDRYENASEFLTALEKRLASLGAQGEEKLAFPSAMRKTGALEESAAERQPLNEHTKNDGPVEAISIFGPNSMLMPDGEDQSEPKDDARSLNEEDTAQEDSSGDKLNHLISGISDKITNYQQKRTTRIQKRKHIWVIAGAIAAVAVIVLGAILILSQTNKISGLTVAQDGFDIKVTWKNGGSGPWQVTVLQKDKEIIEKQAQQREAVFRLAPGYQYTVRVGEESKEINMQEMSGYLDGSIALESATLQYYRVKANGGKGSVNDTDRIVYSPLVGAEGERGYQIRLFYKMATGKETEALCFLISDRFQEAASVVFSPSKYLHPSDVSLNDMIAACNGGGDILTFKVYVDGFLLTQGSFDITTE